MYGIREKNILILKIIQKAADFYESDYYGGYGDYYESPWWITVPVFVTYPGDTDNSQTKDRNNGRTSDTENIRNSGGRGNTDRNPVITNTTPTTTTQQQQVLVIQTIQM